MPDRDFVAVSLAIALVIIDHESLPQYREVSS